MANLDLSPEAFVNGGRLNIFDTILEANYATATLADLVNPKYIGQVVNGTTASSGEDATVTNIKDEEGGIITAKYTKGNMAYTIEIASTSDVIITKFMKGAAVTATFDVGDSFAVGTTAFGWGKDLPIFTAPIAIENQEKTATLVHPKCSIVSNVGISGEGLYTVKAVITVLEPNSDNLQPNIKVHAPLATA